VFWKMKRDLIVKCGGLHKLEPFTAQAALAYDYFMSAGTVTIPALDPFIHPELLGIDSNLPQQEIRILSMSRLAQVDPRIRIISQESHSLLQTIEAVNMMPQPALLEVTTFVQDNLEKLYQLLSASLHPSPAGLSQLAYAQNAMAADGLQLHARFQAHQLWLWLSATSFVNNETKPHQLPGRLLREVSELYRYIERIQSMLQETGWAMRKDVILWIAALGLLVATSEQDQAAYNALFMKTASVLRIVSVEHLKAVLAIQLPLHRIREDALLRLWRVMQNAGGLCISIEK